MRGKFKYLSSYIAVCVIPTSTKMRVAIADWCGVLTVEITVMTSRTTAIVGPASSATVEAVVVMHIAGVVVSLTLSVLHTENDLLADVIVALVAIRTVGGVNTTLEAK